MEEPFARTTPPPPLQEGGGIQGQSYCKFMMDLKNGSRCIKKGPIVSTSKSSGQTRPVPTGSDAVLQRPLVEDVGWEVGESGVHAVLHLQTDGADTQHHKALKE